MDDTSQETGRPLFFTNELRFNELRFVDNQVFADLIEGNKNMDDPHAPCGEGCCIRGLIWGEEIVCVKLRAQCLEEHRACLRCNLQGAITFVQHAVDQFSTLFSAH
ncbi:hypothetical protein A9Q02_14215 [Candidatus Chloroploca asiatica]|uniref:Uncharacterized protein n=1 Tax=Candidatus Chloroploca asiatica TaxID=1506545 RepID=A0A2H3KYD8_9CHLR|nr:hypothetical protein A9Q02_14215 [Candidatus Chloroploca asiatica]